MISDNFDNITGVHQVFLGINNATNGYLALFLMLGVFIITFIALKRYDNETAFMLSSLTTSLFGGLLWGAGMINYGYILIPLIILIVSIFMKVISRTRET